MKIVVDAYAWVELFLGDEKGRKAREVLEEADEIYTPDTVMAEIARKYLREWLEQKSVMARLETIAGASTINRIDAELALEAARCHAELSTNAKRMRLRVPSLFDAIVLGTARLLKAKVLTGDEHFKNQPETLWLE